MYVPLLNKLVMPQFQVVGVKGILEILGTSRQISYCWLKTGGCT